jgi:hypothetical protein
VKRARILAPITAPGGPRLQNHDLGAALPKWARLSTSVFQLHSHNTPTNNLLKKTAEHHHWHVPPQATIIFSCNLPIF